MPRDITTALLRNDDLGNGNFLLEFTDAAMAQSMGPAQFLMIGIPGSETLLRRPYSVCGLPGTFDHGAPDGLQVLYKVFGKGTALLASLGPGAPIRVLGPLGNGFARPADGDRAVFVAGGIGSAPFPALAAMLGDTAERPLMFYGARTAGDLPLADWFAAHTDLHVATVDGSRGHEGFVTEPLDALLEEHGPAGLHLYACGPDPMLHAVASIAAKYGATCDLALEAHMACGFGVCLGCVVPTHGADGKTFGYERVCMEGPVMRAERLAW